MNKFLLKIDVTAQNDIELVTLRELYYILRDDSAKSGNLKVNHETKKQINVDSFCTFG